LFVKTWHLADPDPTDDQKVGKCAEAESLLILEEVAARAPVEVGLGGVGLRGGGALVEKALL
jgi:hypothetical protein